MSTPSSNSLNSPTGSVLDTFGTTDDGGGMQRGASYFFGFLITFVILLLVFVGCGVLSRRRLIARRRRFDWDMEPWTEAMQGGAVGYVPPVLLEKDFIRAKSESSWKDLIPLAALVVSPRRGKPLDANSGIPSPLLAQPANSYSPLRDHGPGMDTNFVATTRVLSSASRRHSELPVQGGSGPVRITSPTPYHRNPNVIAAQHEAEVEGGYEQGELNRGSAPQRFWLNFLHYLNPASWFRPFGRLRRERRQEGSAEPLHRTTADEKPEEERIDGKGKVVQVAMLIEMPSSLLSRSQDQERIPDYQVGVANLPCAGT